MRRTTLCGIIAIALAAGALGESALASTAKPAVLAPSRAKLIATMRKVCDWQWAHLSERKPRATTKPTVVAVPGRRRFHHIPDPPDRGWVRNVFFLGDIALYQQTHDRAAYLAPVLRIAERNGWQPGPNFRFADDLAIGQTYLALNALDTSTSNLAPLRERLNKILAASPISGRRDWWWCDSLFMAPATFAGLSAETGDPAYLNWMDKQFWDSVSFLYDPAEHLFFRDKSFFHRREPNGQPVFWGRGNGWVLAGVARILKYMPADYPSRPKYVSLLRTLAKRIAPLQQPDGFWRSSLLDPDAYPQGESSGTALLAYGMELGINEKVLSANTFQPTVDRAWNALAGAVDSSGRLHWTQRPGSHPVIVKSSDTAEYGAGAMMLLGCEMAKR